MARHWDFTLPLGQTFYMDKLIMHSLVHGREDAAITKDATNNEPKDRLTLMKIGQSVRIKR